jgi:hypothetical protein
LDADVRSWCLTGVAKTAFGGRVISLESPSKARPAMDDQRQAPRNIDALLAKVREIEELLPRPGVVDTDRICVLARGIAYLAPGRGIADLAKKVLSEAGEPDCGRIRTYLSHLKAELEVSRKGR